MPRLTIAPAVHHEAPPEVDQWLPAATSEKLSAQSTGHDVPEIILPDLPPAPADQLFGGPWMAPLYPLSAESVPDASSTLSETHPNDAARPECQTARRNAIRRLPAPDARDRRRNDFASSPSEAPAEEIHNSIWCPPESLYAQLGVLTEDEPTAAWAEQALGQVRLIGQLIDERADLAPQALARLAELLDQADPLASRLNEPALATRLRRAAYALRRRLDVWQTVLAQGDRRSIRPEVDLNRVRLALSNVDGLIGGSTHEHAWREYLLLDALQEASRGEDPAGDEGRRALARRILARVASTPMTETQRQFLTTEPLDRLDAELRRMAAGEPDRAALLATLERYEQTRRPADARRLADECLWLGLRPQPRFDDLHRRMTMHYRNANLRVELSETFANRMMPDRLPEYERVRDTVLGNAVRGRSLTATDVAVRMIPDANRLRIALEISGEIAALTSSSSGPAVFQNTSTSRYTARKPVELTVDGLKLSPAEVTDVNNVTRLRRLQTRFDGIPVLGALIHNVARNQHDMQRFQVRQEVEHKVAVRAKRRVDTEADARLGELSDRLEHRILEPMHELSLGPHMIEANTTEDRLTMRVRVASPRQLGAHTPRPKAPADTLASFQVHESAMNNVVQQLALDGKTLSLPELRARLAERLHWPEWNEVSTDSDDVTITFADEDAVRIACNDGRITIDLDVAQLTRGTRIWNDFQVRVHYRPRVEGLSAELVRDGVVRLPGRRVPSNAQIPLRGIFSKVFSKNRTRQLVPDGIRDNPKMDDMAVTQATIEDGWIALALGPKPRLAQAPPNSPKKQ